MLPSLRGAAPIERAILAGITTTGVTIMQMDEGLDEGDILISRSMPIPDTMTGTELREVMADLSADLLVEAVNLFADRDAAGTELARKPQNHAIATFAPPLRKGEAAIRWADSARDLALRIRAFSPRPGAFAFDGSTRIKLLEAYDLLEDRRDAAPGTVLGTNERGLLVACGRGVLEIHVVQPEGKRPMMALDYERGVRPVDAGAPAAPGRILHDGN